MAIGGTTSAGLTNAQIEESIAKSTGFFNYNDLATQTTPFLYTGGSGFVTLPNDGLGPLTDLTFGPLGVSTIYDGTVDQFDFTQLNLGDEILIRLDLVVTTTANNQEFFVDQFFDIGGTGPFQIPYVNVTEKFTTTRQVAAVQKFFIGNTSLLNNPSEFRISSPNNLSIVLAGWYCSLSLRTI